MAVVFSLALLTGCARARVTTEIRSGGAWTRTVALTGIEKSGGEFDFGGSIQESFVYPQGDGWKSQTVDNALDQTMSFERTFAAGAALKGDLSLKGEAGSLSLINEVAVTRLTPRRFEYRETLRWTGADPIGLKMKPEDLEKLKATLPKDLATDGNAAAVAMKLAELAMPVLFGPGDPLFATGLLHPDLAEYRATERIGSLMVKALEDQFGDKMTLSQRREVTLKLIQAKLAQARPSEPVDPTRPEDGKSPGLTALMFILKSPGKVVSTNGERNELTGEICWALYSPAAALKPVVLTAVVEMNQP